MELTKLYNEYLLNGFNNDKIEAQIKHISEMSDKLEKLKNELRDNFFIPENLSNVSKYLCLGRIVKLKYFGYGIVINLPYRNILKNNNKNNKNNNFTKTVTVSKKPIIFIDEEKLYLRQIGSYDYINCSNEINKINIDNNEIKLDIKWLQKEDLMINKIRNEKNYPIINNSQKFDINCLVSIKRLSDKNYLSTGNFEEGPDNFFGVIRFRMDKIVEICNFKILPEDIKIYNIKDEDLLNYYGGTLKKKMKNKFPMLNIKLKGTKKLNNEITIIQNKYDALLEYFYGENKSISNDDYLNMNLNKYNKIKNIENKIEKIIAKLKLYKNHIFNEELTKMINAMKNLDLLNEDETLTQKGYLISDIKGFDELVITELLSSGFFKDKTFQEIGANIYCCLSNKYKDKKDENYNFDENIIENIFEVIQNKVEYITEVLVECKIIEEKDKNKYIKNFDGDYMMPIYKWIDDETFDELIKEYDTLYEGNLIEIIRKIDEYSENIIANLESIKDNEQAEKFKILKKKMKHGLPFNSRIVYES